MNDQRAAGEKATGGHFEAVILDLDGVVTRTEILHARAWKEVFDAYLKELAAREDRPFQPFRIDEDYRLYVDGKPRQDGARSFLEARGIKLPDGDPGDGPERETIHALANRKNHVFERLIAERGIELYPSTVGFIRGLRDRGIATAIISSSRHCPKILASAGVEDLFDARVDGTHLESWRLKGKPDPDMFLKAAELMDADVARSVVVEDAISGVQAGLSGGFGLVLGVARADNAGALKENGADIVVRDLEEIGLAEIDAWFRRGGRALPSALERFDDIADLLSAKRVAVFLDYDGTLTPIVARPDLAVLSEAMRQRVRRLARVATTAVVSGRDRTNVARLVGIDGLIYVGDHGLDIAGPGATTLQHELGEAVLPVLESAFQRLQAEVGTVSGILLERKAFSLAVHYRLVAEAEVPALAQAIDSVAKDHPQLRMTRGKNVFELMPCVDWDKGKAVLWLMEAWGDQGDDMVPIYLGDDSTDENAFAALRARGVGVLVAEAPRPTRARYRLRNSGEVGRFLDKLTAYLSARPR